MSNLQVQNLKATSFIYAATKLTWSAMPNAVAYQVQYQKKGEKEWLDWPKVKPPTTYATITGLDAGETYNFRVYEIGK